MQIARPHNGSVKRIFTISDQHAVPNSATGMSKLLIIGMDILVVDSSICKMAPTSLM
jgi:hypothetical protein